MWDRRAGIDSREMRWVVLEEEDQGRERKKRLGRTSYTGHGDFLATGLEKMVAPSSF